MNNNNNSIGFGGVLFCIFLVLKLTNVISWSWWWVTAPLWIPMALATVILLMAGVFLLIGRNSTERALHNYFRNLR